MTKIKWLWTYICTLRILVAWVCFRTNKFRDRCAEDLDAWIKHHGTVDGRCRYWQFGYLLVNEKETRNVLLNRLHRNPVMFVAVRLLFCPLESLYISMAPEAIGGGLVFQHGFSTVVNAKKLGKNCKILQQVTVGYKDGKNPVIEDNVTICAGAIVIGDVHIESGAVIGAGAVVTSDVLAGTTVVGVPARQVQHRYIKGE